MARHVLLLSSERALMDSVSAALQSNGKLAADDICPDFSSLSARLENDRASAVLVDVDPDPHRALAAIEPLARRFSETRFVAISASIHNGLLLEAMKAGARHFMLKESVQADLNGVLKHLCPDDAHALRGAAVTILSAGGGCGATTIAVNLAAELQLLSKKTTEPALVVDLDWHYGAVAAYLGVEGQYGFLDVLTRLGTVDSQLIKSSAIAHSESLHALISAPRDHLGEPVLMDPERLGVAIDACKSAYRWTVIDAPRVSAPAAAELVRHSTMTLLLMQLTVKDIRAARRMLAAIAENGVSTDTVRVIATRYRRRSRLIHPHEASKALCLPDGQRLGLLSNDFRAVTEAINLGKTLAQAAPRSDFRRDLQKLAAGIPASQSAAIWRG